MNTLPEETIRETFIAKVLQSIEGTTVKDSIATFQKFLHKKTSTDTKTIIKLIDTSRAKTNTIKKYLESIAWERQTYSNARLESMITASCLRYLAGLTDIYFVIGLSKAILIKYKKTMNLSLFYSTEILTNLENKLRNNINKDTLDEYVNDVQEVITGRRFKLEND